MYNVQISTMYSVLVFSSTIISSMASPEASNYCIEYSGDKQSVKDIFEEKGITGLYEKAGEDENNETYYEKSDPSLVLSRKVVDPWTISENLHAKSYIMFQENKADNSDWIYEPDHGEDFEKISDIPLLPIPPHLIQN